MTQFAQRRTSSLAVASLCLGIGSWILIPIVGAIAAVITGHMARKEIREKPSELEGDGLAIAGLVTGYANLVLSCFAALFMIVVFGGLAAAAAAGQQ